MIKSIIKETFIMLLLCIAIVLLLGILFYDYIPTNRVIPTKEAYSTPNNVKTEIEEQITEIEKTEISYEITDADLNIYKQTSSYKPGKKDPFSSPEEKSENVGNNGGNSTGNTNTNDNNTQNNEPKNETPTKDKNSTGTFFNDEGIK